MAELQHRVVFDFEIGFSNGGGLRGHGFRLDIPGEAIDDAALAALLVDDLRLLMVDSVRILGRRVVREPHKRIADARAAPARARDGAGILGLPSAVAGS